MNSSGTYRRTALLVVLVMSLLGGFIGAQTTPLMVAPADLKWVDAPPSLPPGAKIAILHGDPSKAGLYAIRLKLPANYKVMPHWHPVEGHATVLSGTLYFGIGDTFDPKKGKAFPPGSFIIVPAQTHHFAWTTTKETILQEYAIGPTGTTYINPADDPSKKS